MQGPQKAALLFLVGLLSRPAFAANSYVGIGTTVPHGPLEVTSSSGTSASGPTYRGDLIIDTSYAASNNFGLGNGGLEFYDGSNPSGSYGNRLVDILNGSTYTYDLFFQTHQDTSNWTSNMVITGQGKVGIGTTSPGALLSTGTSISTIKIAAYDGGGSQMYGMGVNGGQLTFGAGIGITGTPQMVLTAAGLMGIGTAAPSFPLDIKGNAGFGYGQGELRVTNASGDGAIHIANMSGHEYSLMTNNADNSFWISDVTAGSYRLAVSSTGNVGIGTASPSNTLQVAGGITVSSCSGCSVVAEMMPIEGPIEEGEAVCIDARSGKISRCAEDMALSVLGVTTTHAEQILRLGCGDSSSRENHLDLGGRDNEFWRKNKACRGWFPVALGGVHEFVKTECFRADGSPLAYGDRLVTSARNPGLLRPLAQGEQGGDAVSAKAMSLCQSGQETGVIHAHVK